MEDEREDLLQAMRTWAKDRLGITDQQVLLAYESAGVGPPVDKPYLLVELTSFGRPQGTDSDSRGDRSATARFHGFGRETGNWLARLGFRTDQVPEDCAVLVPLTGVVEKKVEEPESNGYELQFMREFELTYYITETPDDNGDLAILDLTFNNEDESLIGTIYLEF